jgi:hypothetical protein
MILFPNRFPGRIPSRTHRTTVAAETSSSLATCFVVMYLFVMLNLSAIYTSGDSDASGVACEFAATAVLAGSVGTQDVSTSENVSICVSISAQG